MRLIYTLTLYDVTNTAHLLDLNTGRRSGHGGVARRPGALRHVAHACGLRHGEFDHDTRARCKGDGRNHRRRLSICHTPAAVKKTAQAAPGEMRRGGGVQGTRRDKRPAGPTHRPQPSQRASNPSSKPLKMFTVRVCQPGRRNRTTRTTAKVIDECWAASLPTSMWPSCGA
jgi:hypothetical protein